jgi:vacuolar-type H+-ATPase catalytic subunit A/Vma1
MRVLGGLKLNRVTAGGEYAQQFERVFSYRGHHVGVTARVVEDGRYHFLTVCASVADFGGTVSDSYTASGRELAKVEANLQRRMRDCNPGLFVFLERIAAVEALPDNTIVEMDGAA